MMTDANTVKCLDCQVEFKVANRVGITEPRCYDCGAARHAARMWQPSSKSRSTATSATRAPSGKTAPSSAPTTATT
jgi:hypothetical protein